MSYEYDIFISYRRNVEALGWIRDHFLPLLELRVGFELERTPKIFLDVQTEVGTSWPTALGVALGKSRVLMPLWSRNFLSSVWCAQELSQMLARESEAKLRTSLRPHGVIVPAFIHDGDKFPPELRHMQYFEIQNSFNVRMARDSVRAEELDAELTKRAPAIAACIENAPAWRAAWPALAAEKFFDKFYETHPATQTSLPRFAPV